MAKPQKISSRVLPSGKTEVTMPDGKKRVMRTPVLAPPVPSPETQLIPAWFRDNGREYPVLARITDKNRLRILFIDETEGVGHAERSREEAKFLRPITYINGVEHTPARAKEQYVEFAKARGCGQMVATELGLPGPVERPNIIGNLNPPKPPKEPGKEKTDLTELYKRVAGVLKKKERELREKYGHLNPGLQAMNLRNRLRAAGANV